MVVQEAQLYISRDVGMFDQSSIVDDSIVNLSEFLGIPKAISKGNIPIGGLSDS